MKLQNCKTGETCKTIKNCETVETCKTSIIRLSVVSYN
jgi:hypothetical protein